MERDASRALRISWSCYFYVINAWEGPELKLTKAAEGSLDRLCEDRHVCDPSANKKTL